ncbi:TetR family transcriptional regulator [Burkholderia sp. Ac-20365]|uniref:TetR family transcriptional regulator n=1 Tax=Burkholderia sp. Ac-20365 TaxID=2703897 RepID=UPI00197B5E63|nr:TetR family transcriptional regulator [Burkholderia sp. Ac-20365]MBN3766140.1 TetR family transcriptional regulator [Burkholderia sp. Ac-20365]
MRRTRQQARETRDHILDAAERLFAEHGVSRTSLEDIAIRAGFTRGAIYGHFRNKSDLFVAMTNRVMLPMEMLVAATADPAEPEPLGRIRQLLAYFLGKVVVEPHSRRVFEVLFTKCENTKDMFLVLERQHDAARNGRKHLERGLQNAIQKGQLPCDLDTERAASVLHAFLGGVLRDWLLEQDSIMLPRDAEFLTDVFIGMLRYSPSLRHASAGTVDAGAIGRPETGC